MDKKIKAAKYLVLINFVTSFFGFVFSIILNILSVYNIYLFSNKIEVAVNVLLIFCISILIPIYVILEKAKKRGKHLLKISRFITHYIHLWEIFLIYLMINMIAFNNKVQSYNVLISSTWIIFYSISLQVSFQLIKNSM